ncbi:MAG: glycosyltransferase family 4 protein [Candidatus Omnitrophica bacterium]|nr:glycosyltransferase family 4 protein [Candidatus Omnitrophota bacterium]
MITRVSLQPMVRHVVRSGRLILSSLGLDASPGALLLVTGGGDWVVKQIAVALQTHLTPYYGKVQVLDHLWQQPYVTQANIHCLCRPAFFDGRGIPALHPSNRLVVSWLHGGKDSRDSHLVAACEQLERHWRKVRRFIVPNTTTKHKVLECGVEPDIVHLIPNGVDTKVFTPSGMDANRQRIRTQLGVPLDAFVVGSFQRDGDDQGNPKLIKGPDILVETLAAVHARRPVVALLTGSGRTYVRRRLDELGVPHVYQWLQDLRELPAMYHAIDAYLITSREEGGPTALRESMASGVPVVSTRMGLAADLIKHEVNGLLAEVGDVEGLAKGPLALMDSPSLRKRLAEAALETIRPLDFAVIARRYREEVYRSVFR